MISRRKVIVRADSDNENKYIYLFIAQILTEQKIEIAKRQIVSLYISYYEHADPQRNTSSFLQVPLLSELIPATVEIQTPKE